MPNPFESSKTTQHEGAGDAAAGRSAPRTPVTLIEPPVHALKACTLRTCALRLDILNTPGIDGRARCQLDGKALLRCPMSPSCPGQSRIAGARMDKSAVECGGDRFTRVQGGPVHGLAIDPELPEGIEFEAGRQNRERLLRGGVTRQILWCGCSVAFLPKCCRTRDASVWPGPTSRA